MPWRAGGEVCKYLPIYSSTSSTNLDITVSHNNYWDQVAQRAVVIYLVREERFSIHEIFETVWDLLEELEERDEELNHFFEALLRAIVYFNAWG